MFSQDNKQTSKNLIEEDLVDMLATLFDQMASIVTVVKTQKKAIRNFRKKVNELERVVKVLTSQVEDNKIIEEEKANAKDKAKDFVNKEPRLKQEFNIFVKSKLKRFQALANVSIEDNADLILMDASEVDKIYPNVDKSRVVVICPQDINMSKYTLSGINAIKDTFTERQIYSVAKTLKSYKSFV